MVYAWENIGGFGGYVAAPWCLPQAWNYPILSLWCLFNIFKWLLGQTNSRNIHKVCAINCYIVPSFVTHLFRFCSDFVPNPAKHWLITWDQFCQIFARRVRCKISQTFTFYGEIIAHFRLQLHKDSAKSVADLFKTFLSQNHRIKHGLGHINKR